MRILYLMVSVMCSLIDGVVLVRWLIQIEETIGMEVNLSVDV